ncbi:APC family permease [Spiroplasma culicicola]|uniref:Amino acid permease n=1 Tax=Spiroplasma culicicola AES-1 TaxID=1276246 RepID=W6A7W4_9MOLU|nr:APC family permease [Spiroplasma culicicola]AHI52975.1 amino acid permease [Spiroplasma culicicola AES-1]
MSIEWKEMVKIKKKLNLFDLIGLSLSAIFLLDSFALVAAIGWESIVYWIIFAIVFFIPYCLISSELATSYTDGGIYTWIQKPFSSKWATRMNWLYWLNVSLWTASVYLMFSTFVSASFIEPYIGYEISIWYHLIISCSVGIIAGLVCLMDIKKIKYLSNISAISKILIFIVMIISAIIWLSNGNGISTPITDKNYGIIPTWSAGLIFFPAIVNTLTGVEASSNYVDDIKNPKKDIPKAILITGVITIIGYIVATATLNIVLEPQIDEATGLIDMFKAILPSWFEKILTLLLLLTIFADCVVWNTSANFGISEASANNQFPAIFKRHLKTTNSPVGATIINSSVSVLILIIAGIFFGNESSGQLFWMLYSLGSIISLIPYLFIIPGFLILRYIDKKHKREFKIKGNIVIQYILVILPMLSIIFSIIVFIFGEVIIGQKTMAWNSGGSQILFLLLAVIISILIGELLIILKNKSNKRKLKNLSKN